MIEGVNEFCEMRNTYKNILSIFMKTICINVATISILVKTIINIVFAPLISNIVKHQIINLGNDIHG